jgi:hypothetical protein
LYFRDTIEILKNLNRRLFAALIKKEKPSPPTSTQAPQNNKTEITPRADTLLCDSISSPVRCETDFSRSPVAGSEQSVGASRVASGSVEAGFSHSRKADELN